MAITSTTPEEGLNRPRDEPRLGKQAATDNGSVGGALGAAAMLTATLASLWYVGLQLVEAVAAV
jgi:hypothetical protein